MGEILPFMGTAMAALWLARPRLTRYLGAGGELCTARRLLGERSTRLSLYLNKLKQTGAGKGTRVPLPVNPL